ALQRVVDANAVAMGLVGPPVDRVVPGLHARLRAALAAATRGGGAHAVRPRAPIAPGQLFEIGWAPGPLLHAVVGHHPLPEVLPIIATAHDNGSHPQAGAMSVTARSWALYRADYGI